MKKFKMLTASFLAATILLSIAACEPEDGGVTPDISGGSNATEAGALTYETFEQDPEVVAMVENIIAGREEQPLENKNLKWMAWWDIDRTSAEYVMFNKLYGGEIEFIHVTYGSRYDALQIAITGDDSPDVYPFEINNYPYSTANLFQPVDEYIDLSDERWDDTRDVMEQFEWKGNNYCAVTRLDTSSMLWYRRSVVADSGLPDPKDLFDAGEWDWDAFLSMSRAFSDPNAGKYALDGFHPENGFIISTGVPMIGIEDGKLKSNLRDANVERAIGMLNTLASENLRYPRHEINDYNVNMANFIKGETLFFDDGAWRFEETWRRAPDMAEDVFFVPFPADPLADDYYSQMRHEAHMLPQGSKNTAAFVAWTDCLLAVSKDPEVQKASREQLKNNYKWSDELLDFIDQLETTDIITPIYDFKNGIGHDLADTTVGEAPIEELSKRVYIENDYTYAQLRDRHEGMILKRLDELNG